MRKLKIKYIFYEKNVQDIVDNLLKNSDDHITEEHIEADIHISPVDYICESN